MRRETIIVLFGMALLSAGCTSSTRGTGTGTSPVGPTSSATRVTLPAGSSATVPAPPSSSVSSVHSSPPARPLKIVNVRALDSTTYRMSLWAHDDLSDCAAHSYGRLVAFFRAHPCRHAARYLWTMDFHGRPLALSIVSVVAAPGSGNDIYRYAGQFITLENSDGTGSINDLLREGKTIPGVSATRIPADEVFQVVGQDNGVSVFDAWYVSGATDPNDPALKKLEQSLFLSAASNFDY